MQWRGYIAEWWPRLSTSLTPSQGISHSHYSWLNWNTNHLVIDPCKGGRYPSLGFPDLLILFLLFVAFYFLRSDFFNLYQRPHHLSFLSYSLTYIAWVCFTTFWGAENKWNIFNAIIYAWLWGHHMPFAIHMLYCFQHVFPIVTFHTCHYLYGNKSCISQLLKGKNCSLLEEHLSHYN